MAPTCATIAARFEGIIVAMGQTAHFLANALKPLAGLRTTMSRSHYGLIAPGGERRTQYLREVIKNAIEEIPRYNVPASVTTGLARGLTLDVESPESVQLLSTVITKAAYELRMTRTASMVACDLEDALVWDTDPEKCGHPYRNPLSDGGTICRHCDSDLTNAEEMGS